MGLILLLVTVVGALLVTALVIYLLSPRGPRSLRRHSELHTELRSTDGFVGVDMGPSKLVGARGESVTVLRPAGKISVGGQIYDAVSTCEFIAARRPVKVVKYENAQLYVVENQS